MALSLCFEQDRLWMKVVGSKHVWIWNGLATGVLLRCWGPSGLMGRGCYDISPVWGTFEMFINFQGATWSYLEAYAVWWGTAWSCLPGCTCGGGPNVVRGWFLDHSGRCISFETSGFRVLIGLGVSRVDRFLGIALCYLSCCRVEDVICWIVGGMGACFDVSLLCQVLKGRVGVQGGGFCMGGHLEAGCLL